MAIPFPNRVYVSGDHSTPQPVGIPEFSQPFPRVALDLILKQKFQGDINGNSKPAENEAHPNFPDFFFVSDGDKTDLTGGMNSWQRTYAAIPPTFTEPGGNLNYPVIGFQSAAGAIAVFGRNVMSKNLECQLTHEFFMVGAGVAYATWEEIPVIQATKYLYDYNAVNPVYNNDNFPATLLTDAPPFTIATVPTRTDYEALIAADAGDPTSFSIIAENSTLERWQGNIYRRTTRRVKAV